MISKSILRSRMRVLRRQLADATPDAGLRAAANLPQGWPGTSVSAYGVYHPMGSELDPGAIRISEAHRALPVVLDRDAALVFRAYNPGDPLEPDALGLPAPTRDAQVVFPEVLFVPLLAFDRHGGRLGQGGGFYDRTLAALRARGPVLAVGVAYAGQEVDHLALEPHDQRLDAILTEVAFIPILKA